MTKISSLTEISSGIDADADFLPIVDTSATTTKKAKIRKILNSLGFTKGNIIAPDGTDFGVLGVGTNDYVLTADSTQTYGLKWAAGSTAGQANDMCYPLDVTIGDYSTPAAVTSVSSTSTTVDTGGTTRFSDDFSGADSWSDADSAKIGVDTTNDYLAFSFVADSSNDSCSYDLGLGILGQGNFELRFKLRYSSISAGIRHWIGVSDSPSSASHSSSQEFLGWMCIGTGASNNQGCQDFDGAALSTGLWDDSAATLTMATATDYYVKITRTSTTAYSVIIYSDSGFTTALATFTGTCASTIDSLRYLVLRNENDSRAGSVAGYIDNVQFWCAPGYGNLIDGSTTYPWTSTSENNPNCILDLTSARDIASIALNINKTATTETQIKVRFSTDSSFSDGETSRLINISDFTDDTWRFITIPRLAADCRYMQIYGVSNSVVLSINEVKAYYTPAVTDWNRKHFHRYLSPTSASANTLDSN